MTIVYQAKTIIQKKKKKKEFENKSKQVKEEKNKMIGKERNLKSSFQQQLLELQENHLQSIQDSKLLMQGVMLKIFEELQCTSLLSLVFTCLKTVTSILTISTAPSSLSDASTKISCCFLMVSS